MTLVRLIVDHCCLMTQQMLYTILTNVHRRDIYTNVYIIEYKIMYDKTNDRYETTLTYLDYLTSVSLGNSQKAQITKEYYDKYAKDANDQLNKTTKNNKRYILIRL